MQTVQYWIDHLKMKPHPEGGFYSETYRSEGLIPKTVLPNEFTGDRNFSTAIYFLLEFPHFSAFHRIRSDEMWHFYAGDNLDIHVIHPSGKYELLRLGNNPEEGETFQCVVKAGCWFASCAAKENAYSLVGCTVSPGFDFEDFEMAEREKLIQQFPQHAAVIKYLTR